MRLNITHKTQYEYDEPVVYALQQVRLTPETNAMQTVLHWNIQIEGGQKELSFRDQFGNQTLLIRLESGGRALSVTASGSVDTLNSSGVLGKVYGLAPLWLYVQQSDFTKPGKRVRALSKIIRHEDLLASLHALSAAILEAAPYKIGQTELLTDAEGALEGGHGVCQDHAHIFIAAARLAGVPARYVSGHLMLNDRVDQDASHAWAEAHIDGLGWVGFDVSNGISPDDRYIRLATGLDYRSASPISGLRTGKSEESMIVSVQVQQ